jgi:hypothetical protein
MFSIFELGLFYNEALLDNVIQIHNYEDEEVVFIGKRSGEPLNGAIFHEISKDTISKIKYTALFQNLMKPSLKSSSAIYA